jgi:mevalonate kinase
MAEIPGPVDVPAIAIELNTEKFYCHTAAEARKLGLGSSAAVLVALVGALADTLGISLDNETLTRVCVTAHRNFQHGQGSGVDVAAAINGGVVGVQLEGSGANICVERLSWPSGFFIVPVWSGESASTVELLSNFSSYCERNPGAYERRVKSLLERAESVGEAWRAKSVGQILAAIDGYEEALRRLDQEADIGILTDEHERLRVLAAQCGAHYKTSGAGGGDFGFAYTDSATVTDAVSKAYSEAGFSILGISPETPGLTLDDE